MTLRYVVCRHSVDQLFDCTVHLANIRTYTCTPMHSVLYHLNHPVPPLSSLPHTPGPVDAPHHQTVPFPRCHHLSCFRQSTQWNRYQLRTVVYKLCLLFTNCICCLQTAFVVYKLCLLFIFNNELPHESCPPLYSLQGPADQNIGRKLLFRRRGRLHQWTGWFPYNLLRHRKLQLLETMWLANYTLPIFPLLRSAIVTAYSVDVCPVVCG